MVEKIKMLCKRNGISIRKLEMKLGLSNGTISKWDNSTPRMASLIAVADELSVSIDYLVGRNMHETVQGEFQEYFDCLNKQGADMLLIFAKGLCSQERYRK